MALQIKEKRTILPFLCFSALLPILLLNLVASIGK